jgi:hypothetical protein
MITSACRGAARPRSSPVAADRPLGFVTRTSVTTSAAPDVVFDVIADLRDHVVWSGERASRRRRQNSSVQFSQTKWVPRKFRLCPPHRWQRRHVPPHVQSIGSVVSPG